MKRGNVECGRKCFCGEKPVFFRKYEGAHLCKSHFIRSVEKRVKRTVSKHGWIQKGDKIAVAISGGKDSSAALYLVHSIVKNRPDIDLFAISIDEGIKGFRKEKCLKSATQLCKRLGVKHHVFSFKKELGKTLDKRLKQIKKSEIGLASCTHCGVGRRWILNKKSRELGATKLVLGLNLDDEIQSMLMNYMRGDLPRLARMDPDLRPKKGFILRIKPLREIPEKESALYAILRSLPICLDDCPYRGGVRFDVRDMVNALEAKYPGMKMSILRTYDKVISFIKGFRQTKKFYCKKCGEPGSGEICNTCELWRS